MTLCPSSLALIIIFPKEIKLEDNLGERSPKNLSQETINDTEIVIQIKHLQIQEH